MKLKLVKSVKRVPGIAVGAIGAGYVSKFVPGNDKIKSVAPLILGLLLVESKGMVGDAGAGMIAVGAQKLATSFGLGAVEDMSGVFEELDQINGDADDINGTSDVLNGPDQVLNGDVDEEPGY